MTEQEILRLQEVNGQRSFYLVLVGKFLHACGNGAFALSRATGYRVLARVSPAWYRHVWFSRRGRRVKAVVRMGESVYARKRNNLRA